MTDEHLIATIRAAQAKATKGPWGFSEDEAGSISGWRDPGEFRPIVHCFGNVDEWISNSAYIKALENNATRLLELAEAGVKAREALEPFARVADAYDYWRPEAMPDFTYPRDGISLAAAQEDCPRAVGSLGYHDFRRARLAVSAFLAALPPATGGEHDRD